MLKIILSLLILIIPISITAGETMSKERAEKLAWELLQLLDGPRHFNDITIPNGKPENKELSKDHPCFKEAVDKLRLQWKRGSHSDCFDRHSGLILPTDKARIVTDKSTGVLLFFTEMGKSIAIAPASKSIDTRSDQEVVYIQLKGHLHVASWFLLFDQLHGLPEGTPIILDLRNNLGGFVKSALDISGLFMGDEDTILTMFSKSGEVEIVKAGGLKKYNVNGVTLEKGAFSHLKVAIIIDQTTFSAAEIIAGALQSSAKIHDHDYLVIGKQESFGKWSIQLVEELAGSEIHVKFTTARFRPGDVAQSTGLGRVSPDLYVLPNEDPIVVATKWLESEKTRSDVIREAEIKESAVASGD